MSIQSIHQFVARGEVYRDEISLPVTITGSYDTLAADPVQCTIMPHMENLVGGVFDKGHTLQIRGKTELGKEIWIPELRVEKFSTAHPRDPEASDQASWEGVAKLFAEGDLKEFDASNGEIICSIFTSPTPIALSGVSYVTDHDGTVKMWEGDEKKRKPILWQTNLGEAELIDTYSYHRNEKVGHNQTLIQIQRCQITTKIRLSGQISFKTIISELESEFDNALLLLSFLGRSRVVWYEAQVVYYPDSDDNLSRDFRMANVRRDQWLGYRYDHENLRFSMVNVLVKHHALRNGAFQQLLVNYEKSQYHDIIRQAIIHLLASHERAYLENQYVSAFTALECLVFGLGESNKINDILGANRFKKLSKKLRQLVRSEITDEMVAEDVIKKLPELKRRAFLDRVFMLIQKYDPDLKKLWPPDADIKMEMKRAIGRRNNFFHQGKIDDYDLLMYDLNRLQNLVELLILKVLDCPDEILNQSALGHLVPIQRS